MKSFRNLIHPGRPCNSPRSEVRPWDRARSAGSGRIRCAEPDAL